MLGLRTRLITARRCGPMYESGARNDKPNGKRKCGTILWVRYLRVKPMMYSIMSAIAIFLAFCIIGGVSGYLLSKGEDDGK
jgi:hypothetical protein